MNSLKKPFIALALLAAFLNLSIAYASEEDSQCKDRCEANGLNKETGYFSATSCKEGFEQIEGTCCCQEAE